MSSEHDRAAAGGRELRPPPDAALAVDVIAEAGRQMLESSPSVSEVIERLRRLPPAIGLPGIEIEANLTSIVVSCWPPHAAMPITTMRVVRLARPHLARLAGTDAILDEIEAGDVDLSGAMGRIRKLASDPGPPRRFSRMAILISVVGWVVFLGGDDLVSLAIALLASLLALFVDAIIASLRLPAAFGAFVVAVLLAAIPNLFAAAGVPLQIGPAIVGALFVYLPGRALVSAVLDGLSNAPMSSISRGLEALVTAAGLALGMLVGSGIGAGLGIDYEPSQTVVPVAVSTLGASVGVLGLAIAWAMPRGLLFPTVAIGAAGWLVLELATDARGSGWPAYALAACLVGVSGTVIARIQTSAASVYAGVGILPLVPGLTLYKSMLALSQARGSESTAQLGEAIALSMAIAVGVAVGLGLGRNLIEGGERVLASPPIRARMLRRGRRSS